MMASADPIRLLRQVSAVNGSAEASQHNSSVVTLMASNNSIRKRLNTQTLVLTVGLLITLYNFYAVWRLEGQPLEAGPQVIPQFVKTPLVERTDCDKHQIKKPVLWIAGQRIETGYLNHVIEVFERLGYRIIYNQTDEEWDVLWSHDYPFMRNFLPQLKLHQRVNHFPGSGFITNKVNLATTSLKHIPKAFMLPGEKDEFIEFAKANKDMLWVQKDNNHRGIRVLDMKQLNLDASGTFVQEYIQKPFLIDGKKFDIGLYVMMTSISPLRVYILDNDALLRFCAHPYHPFNVSDLDSYVVGDHYTPVWQMPSLQRYFIDLNLNMKQSFNSYLKTKGKDPKRVWTQIEDAIRTVYYTKEEQMHRMTHNFKTTRHFFELVRFDFALDEELNVYLMEANMSPNLSSSHFPPNKLLYEQVIFNLLNLVGLARVLDTESRVERSSHVYNLMVSAKDMSVHPELCASAKCHLSCKELECRVCFHCLTEEDRLVLKDAILEHNSKWNSKRLIPTISGFREEYSQFVAKSEANRHHSEWFKGKCDQNKDWCE